MGDDAPRHAAEMDMDGVFRRAKWTRLVRDPIGTITYPSPCRKAKISLAPDGSRSPDVAGAPELYIFEREKPHKRTKQKRPRVVPHATGVKFVCVFV